MAQEETLRHLRAKRVGVLAHAASIDSRGVHIVFALRENGIECARIFAPEHGLWGVAQDMESVDSGYDAIVDSHVVSLYGSSLQSLRPDAESLADLDVIVIDIQDIGARYYTFVYTALFLAQAALAKGVKVTGATVHLVNEIPDGGRILLQKAVDILPGDTAEVLQRRVMEQAEWVLLPQAAEMLCEQISES